MKDPTYVSVRKALAEYLNVAPTELRPDHQLERDWGIDRVERSTIALRLEETEDIEIRSDALESVFTVGQLVALVRAIRRREEVAEEVTSVRPRRRLRTAALRKSVEMEGPRRLRLQSGGS